MQRSQGFGRAIRKVIGRRWPNLLQPSAMMWWLTSLSLAVTFCMLGLGGALLFDLRTNAWHQAEKSADNLILTLSRDIARNITLYDLSIQSVLKAATEPGLAQVDPAIRQMALFGSASAAEYLGSMLVVNAEGDIVANSISVAPIAYNIAAREHFQVQKERPDVGLFISRPLDGKIAKDKLIALTRRVNNADGSFGGIVLGAMRTAYFQDLFAKLDLGPKGSVTLFRADGHVIARRPFQAGEIDQDLSKAATFRQFMTAPHGHFVGTAALDQVKRLYTFHHVENLPLVLSIAFGVDDIYADWWRQAMSIGAILTLLCAAAVALSLLFRREIVRRMATEALLRDAANRLSRIAATDGLTGIANRRSFEDTLAQEWRRAARNEFMVAILMLDVDCFKLFNDHYGHQMGDEVLKAVAACIEKNMRRPGDKVARYGGEEFIALMPETDLRGALIVAEAVRVAVAHLAIPHLHGPSGCVTLSIGVAAAFPVADAPAAGLVKQADEALYEAKRAGRNRVASISAPTAPVMAPGHLTTVQSGWSGAAVAAP